MHARLVPKFTPTPSYTSKPSFTPQALVPKLQLGNAAFRPSSAWTPPAPVPLVPKLYLGTQLFRPSSAWTPPVSSQIHLQKYSHPVPSWPSCLRNAPELCGTNRGTGPAPAAQRRIHGGTKARLSGTPMEVKGTWQKVSVILSICYGTVAAFFPPTGTKRRFTRVLVAKKYLPIS
jgi:hypothetical protein